MLYIQQSYCTYNSYILLVCNSNVVHGKVKLYSHVEYNSQFLHTTVVLNIQQSCCTFNHYVVHSITMLYTTVHFKSSQLHYIYTDESKPV